MDQTNQASCWCVARRTLAFMLSATVVAYAFGVFDGSSRTKTQARVPEAVLSAK